MAAAAVVMTTQVFWSVTPYRWVSPTSKKKFPGQFELAGGNLKPLKTSPTTWRSTTGLDVQYITLYIYILFVYILLY
jgi:hypothetical protein